MNLHVTDTTDGKHIGAVLIRDEDGAVALGDFVFQPHEIHDLGDGTYRLANANYSATCATMEN